MDRRGSISGFNDGPWPAADEAGGPGAVQDLGHLIRIAAAALNAIGRSRHFAPDSLLEPTLTRARQALDRAGGLVRQTSGRPHEASPVLRKAADPQDIAACLGEIGGLIRWICAPDIDLSVEVAADLPPVRCSAVDLQNVVLNLVTNARDAMPHGGAMSLAVRGRPARRPGGAEVEIRVADDGIGMSPEALRQALTPFFTPDDEPRLGLAMARRFAQDAGGGLEISSAPGAGTTVAIRLPC